MVLWISIGFLVLLVGLAALLFGEWLSRKVIRPWRPDGAPERGDGREGDPFARD